MTNYRAYFLNAQGRILRAEDLVCKNDEAACEVARELAKQHAVELWERARMVGRFEPI